MKKNVVLIYGPLLHYRVALFNELSKKYNLTVIVTSCNCDVSDIAFELIILPQKNFGFFDIQFKLRKFLKNRTFDIGIVFLDVRNLTAISLIFFPLTGRVICWGAWLTGTKLTDILREWSVKLSDSAIFYCQRHLKEFAALGIQDTNLYVAQNTISVKTKSAVEDSSFSRDNLLFVGSFTQRKGLDRLVRIFKNCMHSLPTSCKLVLVGNGPEYFQIKSLVNELGLRERVVMPGWVTDEVNIVQFFKTARLSISLNQAGLFVLQSLGHGVPFVTIEGSISGGETDNIINGETGYKIRDLDEELQRKIIRFFDDNELAIRMSINARRHYEKYGTISNYAKGFCDAIESTRTSKFIKYID